MYAAAAPRIHICSYPVALSSPHPHLQRCELQRTEPWLPPPPLSALPALYLRSRADGNSGLLLLDIEQKNSVSIYYILLKLIRFDPWNRIRFNNHNLDTY
jgi:hypothetical protein